jgi:hypothetical protein
MATRAAKVGRQADIDKRTDAAISTLADRYGVEVAPAFPPVRDPEFRALDERERLLITLERIVEATEGTRDAERKRSERKPAGT